GRDRRGEQLPGQLRRRRQSAKVVDRADDARDGGSDHHAAHLTRQLQKRERRDEDAEEDREPAQPRDRAAVESPPVGLVDHTEQASHAAHGRRQENDDHERDRRSVEHLWVIPEALEHAAFYFVPYRRSPASPRPGTMYPFSFRARSTDA